MEPLAQRLRPRTLDEVCGQQHLLGKNQVFRRTVESGKIPNMIFYGPSGVGKTTVASIIAAGSGMQLHKLNGTTASTSDIKSVLADIPGALVWIFILFTSDFFATFGALI
ncbi:MAG TPA: AAA family ATPase, partial [Gemmiger formicilis]|nr:AAA family ATPase [Gemmiger formicilis]